MNNYHKLCSVCDAITFIHSECITINDFACNLSCSNNPISSSCIHLAHVLAKSDALKCLFSSVTAKKQCFTNLESAMCLLLLQFCHYLTGTNKLFTMTILFLKDVLLTQHRSKRFSTGCLSLLPKFTSHPYDFLHALPSNVAWYCILSLKIYFSNKNCFNCTSSKEVFAAPAIISFNFTLLFHVQRSLFQVVTLRQAILRFLSVSPHK
jgi:hypothetical protein